MELFWMGIVLGVVIGYFIGRTGAEWRAARHDMNRRWGSRSNYRDG